MKWLCTGVDIGVMRNSASTPAIGRRGFLTLAGATAAVAGVPAVAGSASAAPGSPYTRKTGAKPAARWAGHQPGRVYLGVSSPVAITTVESMVGQLGARRTFYTWTQTQDELATIAADHQADRLPWVSFKPPAGAPTWKDVAAGKHDAELAARARAYATVSKPIIVTFHHEPSNDSPDAAAFAGAWSRCHDVMRASAKLDHVSFVPILGDWAFNPRNTDTDPSAWLPSSVLQRMSFLGIDCYQNGSGNAFDVRLELIHQWLVERGFGHKMIGIGETGVTETFGSPTAASWWNTSWAWAAANTDKLGVVSYFHSERNSKEHVNWSLDESAAKRYAFTKSVGSAIATVLPRTG